jgi:hypothetical protein
MKRKLTHEGAKKRAEHERTTGLDPEDDAARWLGEHDPKPAPPPKKFKSKELHKWRQRQQRGE